MVVVCNLQLLVSIFVLSCLQSSERGVIMDGKGIDNGHLS
jgi:hypothetical protein